MDIKKIYKIIAYLEWAREDEIFFPSSLFWENNISENNILKSWENYLKNKKEFQWVWIYIHYPFCTSLCSYCFIDKIKNDKKSKNYLEMLKTESEKFKDIFKWEKIKNIYIWWWTPSIMSVKEIENLFSILNDNFDILNIEQLTVEVSPLTTTNEKILAFKKNGLNRIVFWVQSLDINVLNKNNRNQNTQKIIDLINYSKSIWIENIKIDLIAWLPWETYESFMENINLIKNKFQINELSIYPFCPHENSEYIKNWWIYNENMILLRNKMMKNWYKFEKEFNKWNFYNKQIIEEEKWKISILWLWLYSISKIFWELVYKKEFYDDYENWLSNWKNIIFSWKKYNIDIEIIWYILRNLSYLSFNEFYKIFSINLEETNIYNKILYLIDIWILVLENKWFDKIIKIKNNNQFNKRIYRIFLYPNEFILKFMKENKDYIKTNYNNIDELLKKAYDLYFY